MSAVREKTKEELFDDLVVALSELEALRAKWDAIPWDAIKWCAVAVESDSPVFLDDARIVKAWHNINAPEEPQND